MNNDLISRKALKEAIETYDKFAYLPNGKLCPCRDLVELEMYLHYIHFDDVIKAIDNAPTVSPKQGERKVYGRQGGIPITDYCTNCKYEMKWYRNKYKYCPNCGASMKGGAE